MALRLHWIQIINENYFTIQLIFATIHDPTVLFDIIYGSYCTISTNFLSVVLSAIRFQFRQNKQYQFSFIYCWLLCILFIVFSSTGWNG